MESDTPGVNDKRQKSRQKNVDINPWCGMVVYFVQCAVYKIFAYLAYNSLTKTSFYSKNGSLTTEICLKKSNNSTIDKFFSQLLGVV